jgi:hypothetical protein
MFISQGFHNLVGEPELLEKNSGHKYWDARLTPAGEVQCAQLKESIRGDNVWSFKKPLNLDLVVVSPLTRCLQTATLSLGRADDPQAPPFVATELCRERVGPYMCDGRRKLSELKDEFPGVDFSLVETEEDIGFDQKVRNRSFSSRFIFYNLFFYFFIYCFFFHFPFHRKQTNCANSVLSNSCNGYASALKSTLQSLPTQSF